jgi:hypothetical protein
MVKRVKYRFILAVPALLVLLAVAWILGNLLLDVQFAGHNKDRKETPLPAPAGGTLRDVFETFPRKGGPGSRIELLERAARGVRITVLTNSPLSSDNAQSHAFFLEQWPELLARVPTLRIFVFGDRHNLHSKVGTIDGRLVLIGTYNIDPFSMAVNGEVVAAVWSEPLARQVRAETQRFISGGPPAVYDYRIARDGQGRPEGDGDGKVVVAFGPEDHGSPEQWKAVKRYWTLLRIAKKVPGTSRLLWK